MLQEVLQSLNNYFLRSIMCGSFVIENGCIDLEGVPNGQYIRIIGSVFNDGVYKYPASDLTDETFEGEVWLLAVPRQVVELSEKIAEYESKHPTTAFDSESFGGYSYHVSKDANGGLVGWQDVFRKQLNHWRKLC